MPNRISPAKLRFYIIPLFPTKKLLPVLALALALTACVDKTGLSAQSSRPPRGNPDAGVTVLEFADLQCPACRAAHTLISKPLLEKNGTKMRLVFKHFPLQQLHRFALEGAEAAECAADQKRFWEFVDMDYEKQDDLNSEALRTWAKDLGMDVPLFDRCIKSHIKRKFVLSEYDEGLAGGVSGTPTFFVNGKKVETSLEALQKAIDDAASGRGQKL